MDKPEVKPTDFVAQTIAGVGRYGTMEELAEALRPGLVRPRDEWPTSAEQFAREYASRSGVTVKWLREHGREAVSCGCGDAECEGWQMGHV
jgi:hypothetical protein